MEILSLLNEDVDSRMESLLDLAKEVTAAAVRLVALLNKIFIVHILLIIGCLRIQNMLPGAENKKSSISRRKMKKDLLLARSLLPS